MANAQRRRPPAARGPSGVNRAERSAEQQKRLSGTWKTRAVEDVQANFMSHLETHTESAEYRSEVDAKPIKPSHSWHRRRASAPAARRLVPRRPATTVGTDKAWHRKSPSATRTNPAAGADRGRPAGHPGHAAQRPIVDRAPAEVWATLLDEGVYLGSISTFYRLLRRADASWQRRRRATHPATVKPELIATAPNTVWSWDITKLRGPAKWTYYYLYVILDIFSRYVVGWMVASANRRRWPRC